MHRIIDALKNHIHQEYKPSSEFFNGTLPDELRKVTNMDNNFLKLFIIALISTVYDPGPKKEILFETHNVFGSKGIDPTYFKNKKGTCHLELFFRADQEGYKPFSSDFYFPRFTLNYKGNPQVHLLCFAVVKNEYLCGQWNIVALKNCEPNLTANHVITNAYALVYIGQDNKVSNTPAFQNSLVKAFENLNSFDQLKNKLNTQLLNYFDDARLKNLANSIKDWRKNGQAYMSMLRYMFLSSEHEKKANSERIFPDYPIINEVKK